MKKMFTLAVLAVLTIATKATTLTLSNATINPGQYTSFTAAIAAASAGDTILVQGTISNYGDFNIGKKIVVIGPGHNAVDKQYQLPATIDNIYFTNAAATGSKVYGINLNQVSSSADNITDIVLSNCKLRSRLYMNRNGIDNWKIDGCVFVSGGVCVESNYNIISGLSFNNCVFNGRFYYFNPSSGYNYINNCIFLGDYGNNTFEYTYSFYVTNSIFFRARPQTFSSWIVFNKCASFQSNSGNNTFPANSDGSSRTVYEGVDPMFENFPSAGAFFDYAHDYHLKSSSPLKAMATDGTDLGVYGNNGFSNVILGYNQNGIPLNPYIKTFNITGPTSVNAGDNLQIYIKAKVRGSN